MIYLTINLSTTKFSTFFLVVNVAACVKKQYIPACGPAHLSGWHMAVGKSGKKKHSDF